MAQKPLQKKAKKAPKQQAANRHGKPALTKKGALIKPPKRAVLKEAHQESLELTRAINADNEEHFATTVAGQPGGKLSILKAPVASTADAKYKAKKSLLPGKTFGAGRR
ncbi:hypothetical protein ACK3TF_003672 [Chlorella vulgaris]